MNLLGHFARLASSTARLTPLRTATRALSDAAASVEVSGVVQRIVYRSPDASFSILSVDDISSERRTVVCKTALLGETQVGHHLEVVGRLVTHAKFGAQIEVTNDDVVSRLSADAVARHSLQETDVASLRKYLEMGMIAMVGPAMAKRIVEKFGEDTVNAMADPKRLQSVSGIGAKKAVTISESWQRDSATGVRPTLMFLLAEFNLTFPQAKVLLSRYGVAAPDIVKRNPFRLVDDIQGIGFVRADEIARRIGMPVDAPARCKAALLYCLSTSATAAGHTCLDRQSLCQEAVSVLRVPGLFEPDTKDVEYHVATLVDENRLHVLPSITARGKFGEQQQEEKEEDYDSDGRLDYTNDGAAEKYDYDGDDDLVFTMQQHAAESLLAKSLLSLVESGQAASGKEGPGASTQTVLRDIRSSADGSMILNDDQSLAVRLARDHRLVILTGGPGTGKTATTRCVIEQWLAMGIQPGEMILTSPTARAARHLGRVANSLERVSRNDGHENLFVQEEAPSSSVGTRIDAKTVHKLLEYDKASNRFLRGPRRPLNYRAVVVDEASMLDTTLGAALLSALKPDARLLIVGDADQLPSVGAGNVLRDLMTSANHLKSDYDDTSIADTAARSVDPFAPSSPSNASTIIPSAIPVVRLEHIYRQKDASDIIKAAHSFNRGVTPSPNIMRRVLPSELRELVNDMPASSQTIGSPLGECLWIDESNAEAGTDLIAGPIMDYVSKSGFRPREDVQVLAPMYKGNAGVAALNAQLKRRLNPVLTGSAGPLHVGDRCMMEKNDYELNCFNGECGIVTDIGFANGPRGRNRRATVTVEMEKDRTVIFSSRQATNLSLSYACTVHKSQGQEFPVVIVPCYMEHAHLLERAICYTALTRAQKLVIFVGQRRALGYALNRSMAHRRVTGLVERLTGAVLGGGGDDKMPSRDDSMNHRTMEGGGGVEMKSLERMWEDFGVEEYMPKDLTPHSANV